MKISPKHIRCKQRNIYILLLLLICLYTQNSCTASRTAFDTNPQEVDQLETAAPTPTALTPIAQKAPTNTTQLQSSPLSEESLAKSNQDAPLLLSPLGLPLFSPLNVKAGSSQTESDELRDAVAQLTDLLNDQIIPLTILRPDERDTPEFLPEFLAGPESSSSLTKTIVLLLPLVIVDTHIIGATESGAESALEPLPTPVPLPTPDALFRTAKVPILMYHYLSEPPANADIYRRDLSVAPDLFARHLDSMLEAGYQTISLYQLTMHLTIGAPLPAKPVVITFDDGYRDNYENAFPLLLARGMTATFFISPEFIERQRPEYADWSMLRTMYAAGMSIEAHGLNHRSLENRDVEFLAWQALASIQSIEREFGQRPRFVSYPAGEYDKLTIEVFRNSHFWAGLTTIQGTTQQSDSLFTMHRVRVRNTTQPNELIRLMQLDW